MRVGIGVSEDLPVARQQRLARTVEDAGFASLWTNEARGRDALLLCQSWAAATERLEVGVGVVPIWTRSPAQLAMGTATLQEASGGRFVLGIGVSHPATMGTWHGADYRQPLTAARDTLTILRTLLEGEESSHEGPVMASRRFRIGMTPRPPRGRVLLAAMGPKMLDLAGEVADGVLLNWSSAEEVGRAASAVRAGATRAGEGRTPSSVEVAAYVRVAIDEDRDAARRALAREVSNYIALPAYADHFARQGFGADVDRVKSAFREHGADAAIDAVSDRMLTALGWYGTPHDRVEPLARYAAAGLDHLIARVVVVGDDPATSVETATATLARSPLT